MPKAIISPSSTQYNAVAPSGVTLRTNYHIKASLLVINHQVNSHPPY